MGGEIDVSVVIVLHNSRAYAAEAVCSARAAAGGVRCEWIIVDCGSTDGAAAALAVRWPDILLRELPNVGYGRGANVGLAAATGRYVLLLNPDTVWLEGTLAALVRALDTMPDVAAAGVLHRDSAGALKPSVMREPTVRRQLGEALALHHLPGLRRLQEPIAPPAGYDEIRDADWLVGAALLVRSSALEQIGGFDPRFFLYSEETDWCVRARAAPAGASSTCRSRPSATTAAASRRIRLLCAISPPRSSPSRQSTSARGDERRSARRWSRVTRCARPRSPSAPCANRRLGCAPAPSSHRWRRVCRAQSAADATGVSSWIGRRNVPR